MQANVEIQQVIAVNIRAERRRKKWRQSDLAALSKVAESGIQEIEAGRRDVHISTLKGIADALGVPLNSLLRRYPNRSYTPA